MSDLETTIRDLVRAGEISHLSLTPSQNGKTWRTAYAMCSRFGISFAEDADPVKSMMLAMTTAKTKKPPKLNPTIEVKADHVEPEQSAPESFDGTTYGDAAALPEPEDPLADLM